MEYLTPYSFAAYEIMWDNCVSDNGWLSTYDDYIKFVVETKNGLNHMGRQFDYFVIIRMIDGEIKKEYL